MVESTLAELRATHATGCLTVTSSSGQVCRIYLLGGEVFDAAGAGAKGDGAVAAALAWNAPAVSFDDGAELPEEPSSPTGASARAGEAGTAGVRPLAADLRVARAGRTSIVMLIAIIATPAVLMTVGLLAFGGEHVDAFFGLSVIAILGLAAAWYYVLARFRFLLAREAVALPDMPLSEIPRVFDAPAVAHGKPSLVLSMPTRSTLGRHGQCRIELYPEGMRIWRGPDRPEPRWQFRYADIAQVETLDVFSLESMGNNLETMVRLTVRTPPIAFLFGGVWISLVDRQNRNAALLAGRLERRGVPSAEEVLGS